MDCCVGVVRVTNDGDQSMKINWWMLLLMKINGGMAVNGDECADTETNAAIDKKTKRKDLRKFVHWPAKLCS